MNMDTRPPPPSGAFPNEFGHSGAAGSHGRASQLGAPPSYAFVTRVYKRSLRPIVMILAFLAAIWTLFSGISFFRSAAALSTVKVPSLVTLSVVLGVLYMVVCAIETFGLFAASTQRLVFVRIYAWLSALTVLIALASGLTRVIFHFTAKNAIIKACAELSEGEDVIFFGFWGPVSRDTLDADEARAWCTNAWNRESWSEIASFIFTLLLAGLFSSVAFSYLRQVLDPSSVANRPSVRVNVYPEHYNPPYNANYGYNMPQHGGPYQPSYGGPFAGPPPPAHHDDTKPPNYSGGDGGVAYGRDNKDPFADFDGSSRPAPGGANR